ncbi:hypothetical protein CaCOL14_010690 [Colletotrichum acutatum]
MVPRNSSTARRDCNVTPMRGFILAQLSGLLLLLRPAICGRRAGHHPASCDCIRIPDELHTDRNASTKLRWCPPRLALPKCRKSQASGRLTLALESHGLSSNSFFHLGTHPRFSTWTAEAAAPCTFPQPTGSGAALLTRS